jgi:hypothetical protein
MPVPAPEIGPLLTTFAPAFPARTFARVLLLLDGTILAVGPRPVAAALRAVGHGADPAFATYHRSLKRAQWSPLGLSRLLLRRLVATCLAPEAPLLLVIDETLERRRGRTIAWRGWFRDPVRSGPGHPVLSQGARWLCVALLVPVPWRRRLWACPFLTVPVLAPATSAKLGQPHRTTIDRAQTLVRLARRWQPRREPVLIGDRGLRRPRPRADLPCPAPDGPGHPAAARCRAGRSPAPTHPRPARPQAAERVPPTVSQDAAGRSDDALGAPARSLVRRHDQDPRPGNRHRALAPRRHRPLADPLGAAARSGGQHETGGTVLHRPDGRGPRDGDPVRGPLERRGHLRAGPPPPRAGAPAAVAHPGDGADTPCLLGLFSRVLLLATTLHPQDLPRRQTAWSAKEDATSAAALAAVRGHGRGHGHFPQSATAPELVQIPRPLGDSLTDLLAYAA